MGLMLLFALMVNLTLINTFYHMNTGALLQSVITTVGIAFLILLDYKMIKRFFFDLSMRNVMEVNIKSALVKHSVRWSVILISLLFTIYLKSISGNH